MATTQAILPVAINFITNVHFAKKEGNGGKPIKAKINVPIKNKKNGFLRITAQDFNPLAFTIPDNQNKPAFAK
jgi:hypothetical protein